MKNDQFWEKCNNGQVLMAYASWQTDAITTNCEHPEKAMQLLDYLNSEEGARLIYSGVEGVHWEYDENGVPQLTDSFIQMTKTDPDYRTKTGATIVQALSPDSLNILAQCDQYMNVQGVKCIMAATPEEFEAAKQEAMDSLADKNYQQAVDELLQAYEEAKTSAESFDLGQ